jgi:hypothetical protein
MTAGTQAVRLATEGDAAAIVDLQARRISF